MSLVENLAGVIIWTEDLERLVAFYRETLGLEPHSVHSNFVAFRFGDVRLSLGQHDKVAGPTMEPYRIMVNLRVTDIHQTYQRLKEAGVPFIRPPEQERWGGWVATFNDPDGNTLQLLQQPSSSSSS